MPLSLPIGGGVCFRHPADRATILLARDDQPDRTFAVAFRDLVEFGGDGVAEVHKSAALTR
jgi:hypothetical protein